MPAEEHNKQQNVDIDCILPATNEKCPMISKHFQENAWRSQQHLLRKHTSFEADGIGK